MRNFKVRIEEAVQTLTLTKFPIQVVVEVVAFCNLKCEACPSRILKRQRGEISLKLFKQIIDEIASEYPNTELYPAYMGEPFLYKDLFEAINYARQKGLTKIFLNTNAMLLDDEICDKILDSGVSKIIASIDGFSAETYEARRIGGDYKQVVENVLNLLQKVHHKNHPLEVWTQMIIDDGNKHEEDSFIDFWLSRGAKVKIRPQLAWGNRITNNYLSKIKIDRIPCPWLMRQIIVGWDGKVIMCDADHEAECDLGDVNQQSIKSIWNTSFKNLQERHLDNDFNHLLCKNCHDWKVGKSDLHTR